MKNANRERRTKRRVNSITRTQIGEIYYQKTSQPKTFNQSKGHRTERTKDNPTTRKTELNYSSRVVNKSTRKRIAGISTKTPHFGVIGTQRNTHMAQKTNSDRKLRHPNFNRKLRHLKNLPSIGLSGLSAEIPQTLLKATIGDYRTCPQKSWNEY